MAQPDEDDAVREGDREVFAKLCEEFVDAVCDHGLRLTGDWSTAGDIMSETFLAAWHNRARVQEDGGTLLFAAHARADLTPREGFDPADHHRPDDIAQLLAPARDVLINETRPPAAR